MHSLTQCTFDGFEMAAVHSYRVVGAAPHVGSWRAQRRLAVVRTMLTAGGAEAQGGAAAGLKVVFLPDSPGIPPTYLFPGLAEAFPAATFAFPETQQAAAVELADADAAMGQLTPATLAAAGGAPRLRLLQSPQAAPPKGFYYEALARHPCAVSNMRGVFSDQLPLHVLAMVLSINRNFYGYRDQQRAHVFEQLADNPPLDATATAVVVGVGAAGLEVARLLKQVFGMRVLGVDSGRAQPSEWLDELVGQAELDATLALGEVVVVTVPHTPETEGLFDAAKFARMRPGLALGRKLIFTRPVYLLYRIIK
jgi:lactate dehydrogenase-like 2-hydroxyacid dehydrogenase